MYDVLWLCTVPTHHFRLRYVRQWSLQLPLVTSLMGMAILVLWQVNQSSQMNGMIGKDYWQLVYGPIVRSYGREE